MALNSKFEKFLTRTAHSVFYLISLAFIFFAISLTILSTEFLSILEKANHFFPRSLSDAPK
jgi:hypothetical protein